MRKEGALGRREGKKLGQEIKKLLGANRVKRACRAGGGGGGEAELWLTVQGYDTVRQGSVLPSPATTPQLVRP